MTKRGFIPPVDIYESDDSWMVFTDLPSVAREDVDLTVEQECLKIRAQNTECAFERSLRLPTDITTDAIQASLVSGVLRLTIPKPAAVRPQRIAIA